MFKSRFMKKFLGTFTALIIAAASFAQITITGKVVDKQNRPLQNASVKLHSEGKKEKAVITDEEGFFELSNIESNTNGKLVVQYVGMKTHEENFAATGNKSFN